MGTLDMLIDWSGSGTNTHKSRPDKADEEPSRSPSHFPPGCPRLLKFIEHALQRAVTLGSREGYTKMRYAWEKDEALGLLELVVCDEVKSDDSKSRHTVNLNVNSER